MINRPNYWVGGDQIQLDHTLLELRKLGVDVDFKESYGYGWSFYAKSYDILHTFNFNMHWNNWLAEEKYPNTKYVCSMIYQIGGNCNKDNLQKMYDNLDAAIFLTKGEQKRLEKDGIRTSKKKHHIIPNGIEQYWFDKYFDPAKVISFTGQMPYVLTVGRPDGSKGQEFVAKACHKLGAPYLNIGGETNFINNNVRFMPNMPREELKEMYKRCLMFVLVSKHEVMPMTVMEAGAQAKNIILTSGCEWKLPNVEYVDFGDVDGIVEAIKRTAVKGPNLQLQALLGKMTWKSTAEQILKVYEKILKE